MNVECFSPAQPTMFPTLCQSGQQKKPLQSVFYANSYQCSSHLFLASMTDGLSSALSEVQSGSPPGNICNGDIGGASTHSFLTPGRSESISCKSSSRTEGVALPVRGYKLLKTFPENLMFTRTIVISTVMSPSRILFMLFLFEHELELSVITMVCPGYLWRRFHSVKIKYFEPESSCSWLQ